PVFGGWGPLLTALRTNPVGTVPALFGGRLGLNRRQLFSPQVPDAVARGYLGRLDPVGRRAQWQLLRNRSLEPAVGAPPVLVIGSPDDRVVPPAQLNRAAGRYRAAPLLFPGMGHDLMLDVRWQEPLDALLDWLDKEQPG
ncbi:alpha/beta hydrolase, partial [Micromonospora zhanjiangensis]